METTWAARSNLFEFGETPEVVKAFHAGMKSAETLINTELLASRPIPQSLIRCRQVAPQNWVGNRKVSLYVIGVIGPEFWTNSCVCLSNIYFPANRIRSRDSFHPADITCIIQLDA
jgi:hypothetical protein